MSFSYAFYLCQLHLCIGFLLWNDFIELHSPEEFTVHSTKIPKDTINNAEREYPSGYFESFAKILFVNFFRLLFRCRQCRSIYGKNTQTQCTSGTPFFGNLCNTDAILYIQCIIFSHKTTLQWILSNLWT